MDCKTWNEVAKDSVIVVEKTVQPSPGNDGKLAAAVLKLLHSNVSHVIRPCEISVILFTTIIEQCVVKQTCGSLWKNADWTASGSRLGPTA